MQGSIFDKLAGHQVCNFIKKRLQHIFSCKYREINKKIYLEELFGKCFMRTFFRSDLNLAKGTVHDLLCERFLKLVKMNKNASYNKVLHEEIKFF